MEHARFRKCYRGRAGRAKRPREHTTHPNISSHNSLGPKGLGAKLRDRISFLGSWKQRGPRFIVVESSIKVPSKFCLPRHNIVVPFYLYLAFPSSLPFFFSRRGKESSTGLNHGKPVATPATLSSSSSSSSRRYLLLHLSFLHPRRSLFLSSRQFHTPSFAIDRFLFLTLSRTTP